MIIRFLEQFDKCLRDTGKTQPLEVTNRHLTRIFKFKNRNYQLKKVAFQNSTFLKPPKLQSRSFHLGYVNHRRTSLSLSLAFGASCVLLHEPTMKTVVAFVAALAGAQAFAPAATNAKTSALRMSTPYEELIDVETGFTVVSSLSLRRERCLLVFSKSFKSLSRVLLLSLLCCWTVRPLQFA